MIRKLFILTIVVLGFVCKTNANENLFQQANSAYSKAAYDSAINSYNKVLASGVESAEVYYNLGNAYFKNKNIANAILNYERAHQLSPNDADINFNLQLAQTLIVDKINVLPEFFLISWWNAITNLFSSDTWAIISIVCFVLMLSLLLTYLFAKILVIKKLSFWLSCLFFVFSLMSFAHSYQLKSSVQSKNSAIVMAASINIKSSPDDKGTDIFVLHEGVKVWVLDEIGDWLKVKIADGNTGWIKEQNIERI